MIVQPGFPSHPAGTAAAQNGHEPVIKLTSALVPNPLSIRPFVWSPV
jgi:hypothetical protein